MKLSLNWLNHFLDLGSITPEEIASKLTMGAFEVEEVQKIGPSLKDPIVVGKILEVQKHPNADRLLLATITTNGKNKLNIVCGAKNIKPGQLVPISLPGAVVVNRKDGTELVVERTKIREIESEGMLLSPQELGLFEDKTNGILILHEDAKLGESVIEYLKLKQDYVLEVASRSNRGDALSVYGLAREISALTHKKIKNLIFNEPKIAGEIIPVNAFIEDTNDTYIFYTTTIENIEIKESPWWLKNLLKSIGIRSINNIVDITNYINFSFGQPMHAYDKEKLSGNLTSRKAKKGEKIVTLDGKLHDLSEEILVIADSKGPVALAGIMGGKDTEVSENTTKIVFEAAVFNPVKVRRGSRKLGISTESSKRFERWVDSNFTYKAILKAIELTCTLASPTTKSKAICIGKTSQAGVPIAKNLKIKITPKDVKRVLNIDLSPEEITSLLSSLEFKSISTNNELTVLVPEWRINDITRPIDLIEEIARLHGYNTIKPAPPPSILPASKSGQIIELVKNHLFAAGFSEVYLSSLVGEHILNYKEFPFNDSKAIKMVNPVSKEHTILRQSLLPCLLDALKLNQNHQTHDIKLFEIGKVYFQTKNKVLTDKETSVDENIRIAGVASGYAKNWYTPQKKDIKEYLFFWMKGIIEELFYKYVTSKNQEVDFQVSKEEFLHPNFGVKILFNNQEIGSLGCLHPQIEKRLEINEPTVLFELNLELIQELINNFQQKMKFHQISTQPAIERDITIDIPLKYPAGEVTKKIKEIVPAYVTSVSLISTFNLNKDVRSLTYRLRMQDLVRTLTSKEVEEEVNKVINTLTSCFEAKFRV